MENNDSKLELKNLSEKNLNEILNKNNKNSIEKNLIIEEKEKRLKKKIKITKDDYNSYLKSFQEKMTNLNSSILKIINDLQTNFSNNFNNFIEKNIKNIDEITNIKLKVLKNEEKIVNKIYSKNLNKIKNLEQIFFSFECVIDNLNKCFNNFFDLNEIMEFNNVLNEFLRVNEKYLKNTIFLDKIFNNENNKININKIKINDENINKFLTQKIPINKLNIKGNLNNVENNNNNDNNNNNNNNNNDNNNNNNDNNDKNNVYKKKINEESILINSHLMNDINKDLAEIESNNDILKSRFCLENENKEDINRIIKVYKHISNEFKEENDVSLIEGKLLIINSLDEKNYEITFENFIEKFKKMFFNNNNNKKYNFFYENILISMFKYCVYNKNGKVLKILIKFLNEKFSDKFYNNIHEKNNNIVNLLENFNFENNNNNKSSNIKNLNDLIKFGNDYSNFIKNFNYDIFNNKEKEKFNVISNIFCKILEICLNKNINKKFINDFTNMLNNLQIIREEIINKNNNIINEYEKENVIFNNMIKIFNDDNNNINIKNNENYINIIIFEIEKILNLFLKIFDEKSLENVFENLMDLTETDNNKLRTSSKNLIKLYIKYKLFVFKKYNNNDK